MLNHYNHNFFAQLFDRSNAWMEGEEIDLVIKFHLKTPFRS